MRRTWGGDSLVIKGLRVFQGGWTALMWAAYKGRVDVTQLLLENGANPNTTGQVTRTMTHAELIPTQYDRRYTHSDTQTQSQHDRTGDANTDTQRETQS